MRSNRKEASRSPERHLLSLSLLPSTLTTFGTCAERAERKGCSRNFRLRAVSSSTSARRKKKCPHDMHARERDPAGHCSKGVNLIRGPLLYARTRVRPFEEYSSSFSSLLLLYVLFFSCSLSRRSRFFFTFSLSFLGRANVKGLPASCTHNVTSARVHLAVQCRAAASDAIYRYYLRERARVCIYIYVCIPRAIIRLRTTLRAYIGG